MQLALQLLKPIFLRTSPAHCSPISIATFSTDVERTSRVASLFLDWPARLLQPERGPHTVPCLQSKNTARLQKFRASDPCAAMWAALLPLASADQVVTPATAAANSCSAPAITSVNPAYVPPEAR